MVPINQKVFTHIVVLFAWVIVWLVVKIFIPVEWHLIIGALMGGMYGVFTSFSR